MNQPGSNICPECGKPVPPQNQHQLCPACLMAQAMASQTIEGEPACSAQIPQPEEIAEKFPQFEILECLGRGGMGVVYKARQKSLNRLVAIKILAPEREHDTRFAGRFAREAECLAKLNHPHIVTIHDFGQTGGLYYFVMEFVEGVSLRDLLREGKLAPKQALSIVPEICDALQFAHDHGVVHRDIKPENILLDRQGHVKVADFGLAKLMETGTEAVPETGAASGSPRMTEAGKVVGTPSYMAPEQTEHPDDVDHRADIYSLGVVIYQMLTGELPGKRAEPPSRKVQVDVRLDEVVLRALAEQPERRYQQVSQLKTMVEDIAGAPQGPEPSLGNGVRITEYAGFWRRFFALYIDYALVSIAVFPIVVAIGFMAPDSIVVSVPFGLFTSEQVVETSQSEHKNNDGSTTMVDQRFVEVTTLGHWKYLYRETVEHTGGNENKTRQLIDSVSRQDTERKTANDFIFWILLIYWIAMESSKCQASVGKMILGIRVVDRLGRRPTIGQSLIRNVSKFVSAITLGIGFLMAGWTSRKQALHDMIAHCYVAPKAAIVPNAAGSPEAPGSEKEARTRRNYAFIVALVAMLSVPLFLAALIMYEGVSIWNAMRAHTKTSIQNFIGNRASSAKPLGASPRQFPSTVPIPKKKPDEGSQSRQGAAIVSNSTANGAKDADGYLQQGKRLLERNAYDEAIASFDQTIQLNPQAAPAYFNRGRANKLKGNYDQALSDYTQAIRLKPAMVAAYVNRGQIYNLKEEFDQAIADFNEAIRRDAHRPIPYNDRGAAYASKGDFDKARADFISAINCDLNFFSAYHNLARQLATSPQAAYRDGKSAVEYATKACELSGWNNFSEINLLAAACAEAGDFESALKWQNEVLANPDLTPQEKATAQERLTLYQAHQPFHRKQATDP